MNVPDFIASISNNNIAAAYAKAWDLLDRYYHPVCSISGGSDSDIMLDIIHRLDVARKVRYVWFNTGLEYAATKRHLDYLQDRYSITIERFNAVKSIPACVRQFGYPFLSKFVSQRIAQLQRHGFLFQDSIYEEDVLKYKRCSNGIQWWHNKHSINQWNINYHKHLKAFLIAHPPSFSISDKCCYFAKKKVAADFIQKNNCDLNIIGTRKAEGGIRAMGTSCFSHSEKYADIFRPIFWFNDSDKKEYELLFHIKHSDCYKLYGLKRTGCAGCPFNRQLFTEMLQVKEYEGGLLNAAQSVFGTVYDYTKLYGEFCSTQGSTLPLLEVIHD